MKSLKEDWGTRFDKIEQLISKLGGARCMAIENPEAKVPTLKMESSGDLKGPVVPTLTGSVTVDPGAADTSPSSSFGNLGTDSAGSDLTRTNAIYIEHNTAAQKLFRWRSIRALLSQSSKLDFSPQTEKYVMDFERNKGVLRVYGRGRQKRESGDLSPKSVHTDSPANSHVSGPSDDTVTTSSPVSSPENLWGTGFVPTAGESRATSDVGGLGPDNTLKLDPKTITRLIRSYIDNIHIMHPFLDERALTRQVELFKRRYNPHDYSSSKGSFAVPINTNLDAVQNSYAVLNIPSKRKHSDGCYHGPGDSSLAPSPMPKIFLERSPETAMILLVLALGKICECTTPLPGPVPETAKDFLNPFTHPYSPTGGRIDSPPPYPQPMRQSPSSQSTTSTSAPSPMSASRFTTSSPKSSVGEMPGMRNVDVIPGLAYYAQATDILGNIAGLHELIFAQCCLLAGLYAGQLANTLESLTWIQTASRTCRFLVQE